MNNADGCCRKCIRGGSLAHRGHVQGVLGRKTASRELLSLSRSLPDGSERLNDDYRTEARLIGCLNSGPGTRILSSVSQKVVGGRRTAEAAA